MKGEKNIKYLRNRTRLSRLSALIDTTRERNGVDIEYLKKLESELDRAEIVDPKDIPDDVITMRSRVRLIS